MAEPATLNRQVVGSIPTDTTIFASVVQLGRTRGSYPPRRQFKSDLSPHLPVKFMRLNYPLVRGG